MACVPSGLVNIVDFQGNVLDNSFTNALPSSANNPDSGDCRKFESCRFIESGGEKYSTLL